MVGVRIVRVVAPLVVVIPMPPTLQVTVGPSVGSCVIPDDVAPPADPDGEGRDGTGEIDCSELAPAEQKSVTHSIRTIVRPYDITASVYPVWPGKDGPWEIHPGKVAVLTDVAANRVAGADITSHDGTARVDAVCLRAATWPLGRGADSAWKINHGETAIAQHIAMAYTVDHAQPGGVPSIVDPVGAGEGGVGAINRGELAIPQEITMRPLVWVTEESRDDAARVDPDPCSENGAGNVNGRQLAAAENVAVTSPVWQVVPTDDVTTAIDVVRNSVRSTGEVNRREGWAIFVIGSGYAGDNCANQNRDGFHSHRVSNAHSIEIHVVPPFLKPNALNAP